MPSKKKRVPVTLAYAVNFYWPRLYTRVVFAADPDDADGQARRFEAVAVKMKTRDVRIARIVRTNAPKTRGKA